MRARQIGSVAERVACDGEMKHGVRRALVGHTALSLQHDHEGLAEQTTHRRYSWPHDPMFFGEPSRQYFRLFPCASLTSLVMPRTDSTSANWVWRRPEHEEKGEREFSERSRGEPEDEHAREQRAELVCTAGAAP